MLCQNGAAVWFDFTKGSGCHTGTLQAEGEAAHAAEKVQNGKLAGCGCLTYSIHPEKTKTLFEVWDSF
jgi:hypothetical protein